MGNPLFSNNPKLSVQEVQDIYIRNNFKNLQDYFNAQNQLLGFNFFELIFTEATTNYRFKHGLQAIPKDIIMTQVTGLGVFTVNFGLCDNNSADITVNGACRVRFFLGTYWRQQSTAAFLKTDTMQFSSNALVSSVTNNTTAAASSNTASNEIFNLGLTCVCVSGALVFNVTQKDGSLLSSSSPVKVGFRNSTVATGQYTEELIDNVPSFSISSGSTLGMTAAVPAYLYVYLIKTNVGFRVAVVSIISNFNAEDGAVTTTTAEGGVGGADTAAVVYAEAAYSAVPCRLIGRIQITQATPGTWTTAPAEIRLQPFPIQTAWSVNTILTATSAQKTPTASGNYNLMTGNSVSLTAGTWEIFANFSWNNNGGAPAYSTILGGVYGANGADNGTPPVATSWDTAQENASVYFNVVTNNINASTPNMVKTVTSTTLIYAVPYAAMTTAANSRINLYLNARRIF